VDAPVALRRADAKARTTDNIRPRQRITEEPRPPRSKRISTPLLATMIVPAVLLALLLVPRILGVNIFPTGFPLLGAPAVATISVTAQSRPLQQSYVLTTSTQVKAPDLATHTIPNRVISATANDSSTVSTTGSQSVGGVAAEGTIEL